MYVSMNPYESCNNQNPSRLQKSSATFRVRYGRVFNTCMTWSGMLGSFAGYRRFSYSLLPIWILKSFSVNHTFLA